MRILVLFVLLLAAIPAIASAQPAECGDPPSCGSSVGTCNLELLFRCESNQCGGDITRTLKSYTCQTSYQLTDKGMNEAGCPIWECQSLGTSVIAGPKYTQAGTYQTCGDYRRCSTSSPDEDGNGWYEAAACQCSGSCYPAPELKDIKDPSLSPKNILDGFSLPKLPVNLGWKDNVKKLVADTAPGLACPIGSYSYEVTGNGKTVEGLEQENLEDTVGECQLASQESYEWRVRACLEAGGEDCGAWSKKGSFETSDAPEPFSPFDADFAGEGMAKAEIPTTLEWCPIPGTSSYRYRIYQTSGDGTTEILNDAVRGTKYDDNFLYRILNKGVEYFWDVASCVGGSCTAASQLWGFVPGDFELQTPKLTSPRYVSGTTEPVVNFSDSLAWSGSVFSEAYLVRITGSTGSLDLYASSPSLPFSSIWQNLAFNASYSWKVAACTGKSQAKCQKTDSGATAFSETWRFTTTGAPPSGLQGLPHEGGSVGIPTTLDWSDVPGAASYAYEVSQENSSGGPAIQGLSEGVVSQAGISSGLQQNTSYLWRVRTCADPRGAVCGAWSQGNFRTATLFAPQLNPNQTLTTPSDHIFWKTVFGANFYAYELTYTALGPGEISPSCQNLLGKGTGAGTATGDSALLPLQCTGTYGIRIQGCTDKECQDAGPWSQQQSFLVKEPDTSGVFGLVPCGVGVNNPSTPWDERQPCGFGHILLLARNLIDFALWKLSLIIIILLAIATGAVIYFSFGGPDLLNQLKSIWKAAGIGVLILLFSWLLLNLFLGFVGFDVGIFGNWYELPL